MFDGLTHPVDTVNGYLWDTMKAIEPQLQRKYKRSPFYPATDNVAGDAAWKEQTYVLFDRMLRNRRNPFYPIKNDHFLYYLKSNELEIIDWANAIQLILDRQDDAAQDVNDWNRRQETPASVYFHHLRVYQADTGDMGTATLTRDFNTNSKFVTRFIVEAEYHFTVTLEDYL